MTDSKQEEKTDQDGVGAYLVSGFGHALGVCLTAAALLLLTVPFDAVLPYAGMIVADDRLVGRTVFEACVHLGLSTAIWALLALLFSRYKKTRDVKVVKLTNAGSVLTETIVVLPVMFLIIFGLAQVATNNIAGMLANVAAFQGARSAWVWQGEIGANRGTASISADDVEERARIASALVMTPVAPGGYRTTGGTRSQEFKNVREAVFAGQFTVAGGLAANASSALSGAGSFQSQEFRMSKALDEESFEMRTLSKFTHAYDSVNVYDVNVNTSQNEITYSFEYLHFQAYPVVGLIFGERLTSSPPSGRKGHYARIKREVTLPMRVCDGSFSSSTQSNCPANPAVP